MVPAGVETTPFAGLSSVPQFTGAHIGALPLHAPSVPHVRVVLPVAAKPGLHAYVAVWPTVVPEGVDTDPFAGAESIPHSAATVHVPPE